MSDFSIHEEPADCQPGLEYLALCSRRLFALVTPSGSIDFSNEDEESTLSRSRKQKEDRKDEKCVDWEHFFRRSDRESGTEKSVLLMDDGFIWARVVESFLRHLRELSGRMRYLCSGVRSSTRLKG